MWRVARRARLVHSQLGNAAVKRAPKVKYSIDKLRALANPDRLRIVQCLREHPRTVGEIGELLHIPLLNLSHHLRTLRSAGAIVDAKHGRFVTYSLDPTIYLPAGADDWCDCLELGCCRILIPKDMPLVAVEELHALS